MQLRFPILLLTIVMFLGCTNHKQSVQHFPTEEMDGMEQAMQQEFQMTRDPALNIIPNERMVAARSYMQSLDRNNIIARTTALSWQERGPNNVGGRTRAIMIDKRDATGNTVLAGSVSGGLFKTINFVSGSPVIWTPVNDFLPNLAISSLVQDNTTPATMYAATGEGWFNADAVRGAGIYKSTDGGVIWNQLASTVDFEFSQDFVIDNNGNIYASLRNQTSANRGVMRSTNGGTSWVQVLGAPLAGFATGRAADLEVASNGDMYATLGVFSRGVVWKSSFATHGANTGAAGNWVEITPPWLMIRQRVELAIAPSDPQRLYVIGQDSASSQVIGLWRSFNGGASWDSVASPSALNNGTASQTWFNLIMAVDPNNPDVLVAGGLHVAKSITAGVSWLTISSGQVHVDHHVLQYNSSSKLINGNDGGISYSENIDAATPTFSIKNNSYNITQYYACDYHPSSANYFLAGAQDNGTQKFIGPGINATTTVTGGDGGYCHIDQTDGLVQITAFTRNSYNRSTNGGTSFSSLGTGINNTRGQFINPTDYDDNANILYCGDDAGRYFVISGLDATPSSIIANVSAMGSRELTAVKVDPNAATTIWVGASSGNSLPMVLKISNANSANPTVTSSPTLGTINNAAVSSIDVDPANSNHILATLSNFGVTSVWESTDGGISFSSIEGNLPDMPIRWGIFAPANAQLNGASGGNGGILLGTELGVWSTSVIAGTATQWIPNNTGLANVKTSMLKFRSSDNTVVAGTHGRGLFTTIIPTVPTGLPNTTVTKDFIKYVSADKDLLQVVTGTLQTRTMTLQLFDMKGSIVYSSSKNYQHSVIDISRFQSGSYIIKITGNNKENFVKQFIK
ncbi:MAG: T9SS type A sorting domain-containing protein [Bacteroidota bacterium]|nr:T9SS type A sorting domain-containing protein [Bacteroidota bacterium]